MTRFQNRVAASRMLLPFIIVYAIAIIALSLRGELPQIESVVSIVCFAVAVAMMVALNNQNALIRVYSRMVSAAFVAFTLTMPAWIDRPKMLPMQCCYAIFLYMIMPVYHDPQRVGRVFYSFLFVGVASLMCPPTLWLLPVWLIGLFACILTPSLRCLMGALFGVAYPWLIYFVWTCATGNVDIFIALAEEAQTLAPLFAIGEPTIGVIVPIALFNLVVIISSIHFFMNDYADKVRTRQIFEFLILMHFVLLAAMIFQPAYLEYIFALQLCVGAPVAGHFAALSSTKLSNLTFMVIILCIVAITAYNLWMLY